MCKFIILNRKWNGLVNAVCSSGPLTKFYPDTALPVAVSIFFHTETFPSVLDFKHEPLADERHITHNLTAKCKFGACAACGREPSPDGTHVARGRLVFATASCTGTRVGRAQVQEGEAGWLSDASANDIAQHVDPTDHFFTTYSQSLELYNAITGSIALHSNIYIYLVPKSTRGLWCAATCAVLRHTVRFTRSVSTRTCTGYSITGDGCGVTICHPWCHL